MGGIFRGHNTVTRADMLSEFQLNQATYGEPVPVVIGTTRLGGNVIDYCDFTAHEHKETQRVGKGGGRSRMTNITYTYSVAVALGLCEGPINGIGRVWVNKDVYNYPSSSVPLTLFNGSYNQRPWQYMTSKHPERALPYSGLAYMAGEVDLGSSASLPQYSFEVKGLLLNKGDGVDVNPADYILYILTDETNGVGFSKNDINLESLNNARKYWAAANLLISSPKNGKSRKAQDIINQICTLTGVYVFWSQNKLKFVPIARDRLEYNGTVYEPNNQVLYDLTKDDFIPSNDGTCVTFERTDSAEAFNQAHVEFNNRANSYEAETVTFEVTSDVLRNGVRPAQKVTADYIYTKQRAMFIAERLAKEYVYARNTYRFELDWAYNGLEPGDLVTITDEPTGLRQKVVIIKSIREGADGGISVSAVSAPDGMYSSALYNLHNFERPTLDRNITPPSVENVTIFQPAGDVTNGHEIWLGLTAGDHWGGCNVHVSDDNAKYKQIGSITRRTRLGRVVGTVTASSTEITIQLHYGELLSGSEQDAQRANTLLWLNGELLSYTTATLIGERTYTLTGLVRGQYGTAITAHSAGSTIVRCDENVFKQPFRDEDIGKKIWLKFTSFNEFENNEQELSQVKAYSYIIKKYYVPQVNNLTARAKFRQTIKGLPCYDIIVNVEPPSLKSYDKTAIYYKTSDEWLFAGYVDGTEGLVISQVTVGETYTIKAIVHDKYGGISDDNTARQTTVNVNSRSEVPLTPEGLTVTFQEKIMLSWREVLNTDVDYYEIRSNENVGNNNGLITRVNSTTAFIQSTQRQGTFYVFAHNPNGRYSFGSSIEYNKPKPSKPTRPQIKSIMGGLSISCDPIPSDSFALVVMVEGERIETRSNVATYFGTSGVKNVTMAYKDCFGEGIATSPILGTVKTNISKEDLAGLKLSSEFLDQAIQDKINQGQQAYNGVTSVIQSLNGNGNEYSAIAQLNNALALKVNKNDVVSAINLAPQGVKIDGRLIQITGDTVFDQNVNVANMLQAGSITADKIAGGILNLSDTELGIQAGFTQIDSTGVTINTDNGKIKFEREGVFWYDQYGTRYNALGKIISGEAMHGDYIKCNFENPPEVIVTPVEHHIKQNMYFVCEAVDITNEGFSIKTGYDAKQGDEIQFVSSNSRIAKTAQFISYDTISFTVSFSGRHTRGVRFERSHISGTGFTISRFEILSHATTFGAGVKKAEFSIKCNGLVKLTISPAVSGYGYSTGGGDNSDWIKVSDYEVENSVYMYITKNSGNSKGFLPASTLVKFIAIEKNESLYRKYVGGIKPQTFKGRGTYTFTAKGRKAKICVIGASVKPSNGRRPSSAESSFVGNGINIRSNGWDTSSSKQNITAYHGSNKYNEHENLFVHDVLGFQPKYTYDQYDEIKLKGYDASEGIENTVNLKYSNGKHHVLTFDMYRSAKWNTYTNYGNYLESGIMTDLVGCSWFEFDLDFGRYQSNPGGYARRNTGTVTHFGGLSVPIVQDVTLVKGQQYTITIGACPDVNVGTRVNCRNDDYYVTVANTSAFDGGVIIYEVED